MNIAFIGFGDVAYNLTKLIQSPNINFITSTESRSADTISRIKKANITVLEDFKKAAKKSDILISAASPASALDISRRYGKYGEGIYLDLNNVSPKTTLKINENVDNLVDGAIIGKIDDNPTLYLSGEKSGELLFLDEFINVKIIGDNVGDASLLKLLRSTYTKSLSALLIETNNLALQFDLEDELWDMLSLSEGDEFVSKSISRINNTKKASKRKSEELTEILEYFGKDNLKIACASLDVLKQY